MTQSLTNDSILVVRKLGHRYGPSSIFEGLDLVIGRGERVAIVGPSGSGKSTLLQLCAGLLPVREGTVERNCRRSAVVFQTPTLLPWKDAYANIEIGLRALNLPTAARRDRVLSIAASFGLAEKDLPKYPHQLSGGMQCRVSLARAFAIKPDLIFLDEPFSALDVGLKAECHDYLLQATGVSVFFITHDLMEAVRLGDRVLLLGGDAAGWIAEYGYITPPPARSDAVVHAETRALLERPEVRACFGLNPAPPSGTIEEHDLTNREPNQP